MIKFFILFGYLIILGAITYFTINNKKIRNILLYVLTIVSISSLLFGIVNIFNHDGFDVKIELKDVYYSVIIMLSLILLSLAMLICHKIEGNKQLDKIISILDKDKP